MTLDAVQWTCALLGAVMVGVSKTGITGLGILFVALFAHVFPSSKQASGLVLPLLVFGDVIAVAAYRAHTQWRYLWRLFPWTALGVVLGYLALGRISDRGARLLVGAIIFSLAVFSYVRRARREAGTQDPSAGAASIHWGYAAFIGVVAGFVTLIANAAGPLMAIYLVAMRLPKLQYVGTAAVFFLLLNLFKVPFMVSLGLITWQSFEFNVLLLPAVVLGAALGRVLLRHIDQALFEKAVLALSAIAGLALLA